MHIRALKYGSPLIVYFLAVLAFTGRGWLTWAPLIMAWIILPLAELFTYFLTCLPGKLPIRKWRKKVYLPSIGEMR